VTFAPGTYARTFVEDRDDVHSSAGVGEADARALRMLGACRISAGDGDDGEEGGMHSALQRGAPAATEFLLHALRTPWKDVMSWWAANTQRITAWKRLHEQACADASGAKARQACVFLNVEHGLPAHLK
jgi:hypothetical protein